MTVALDWPASLPRPLLDTHAFEPKPSVIRSESDNGAIKQRRRFKATMTDVPFSLVLDAEQFQLFDAWVEHKAKHGGAWFNIELLSGIGLSMHQARLNGPLKFKQISPDRWSAMGTLEVRERPILTEGQMEVVLDSDPFELFAVLADFHQLVHFEIGQ